MPRQFSIRPFGIELEVSNIGRLPGQDVDFPVKIAYIKEIVKRHTSQKVLAHDEWSQSINNDYWHIKYDATCGILGKGPGFPHGWDGSLLKNTGF